MQTVHIIYASTSGHTEHVVDTLISSWKGVHAQKKRAEQATPEDLLQGDMLILASSTWNTGGPEGQLNPHMHAFVAKAKDIDLKGKKVAVIGLGDSRYRYTCRAADHLVHFVAAHKGKVIEPPLCIINEPWDQDGIVKEWGAQLLKSL
ncbi:flavodoxin family protein [Candidatus Peregrinibacteria bacterium]|nr:flavodoxin family protein [Candidatus Peregrinibacteria bacterium]